MKVLFVVWFLCVSSMAYGHTRNYYDVVNRTYEILMKRNLVSQHPRTMVFKSFFISPNYEPSSLFKADLWMPDGLWEGVDFNFYQYGHGTRLDIVVGLNRLGSFDAEILTTGDLLVTATPSSKVIKNFICGIRRTGVFCDLHRFDESIYYRERPSLP